ncbi:Arabinofuranan 3-O-arabinosyltransferase [Kibdelosporangium persicum]|uniref:Arabinofuranan 3-O-arabinosyltransferase n=1 Tax=Kibdelosporangium persicum TaxID=2698649 RepID=A0ABX2EYX3_9PSEU|nr:Arabinofuranan 3-O-arabinosyltransferase [Kibdelosporangium persicum]
MSYARVNVIGVPTKLRSPTPWVMLGLTLVSFLQRPGRTTFDTKLDLAVDPLAFLGRALHLWNPEATGGELQNQAYGYLFPMGPYFAACQLLGVPPWIAQRLWCALLLCLAFYGVLAIARTLRIGNQPAQYTGAVAYALAPRMLTEIGPLSAEMLAPTMLPWVLLPLVKANRIGSPRRAAGLSGLAVLCIGGINGAVVILVLVLPALWLLTREWTRQHGKLVLWWIGSVTAAVLWWFLPLTLLGQYSLPFVDYVESATNTTSPMSLFQAMRGTNQWVAYVVQGSPWWPSGFMLVDNPVLMLATGLVAAIGLAGLVRRGLPERRFITIGVITTVTFLTIGYVGSLDSPLSETVRQLLDGPLAPLRNVHKFEPGLRLPLMLAFMHAVSRLGEARAPARARLSAGIALVLVMAAPAWLFTLRPGPGWTDVPGYWRQAMTWLGENDPQARTLLVPGTGFGEYTWGRTVDEPAQALARSPWALRSQIPLGSEGNTRIMDAVEDVLADGRGSAGLADFLARSGHRFLLLRNDIDRAATGAPPVTMMRDALARSPGIDRVMTFGPDVAARDQAGVASVDLDAPPGKAIEIYEVKRPVARAVATNLTDVATVSGGPESLLPLLDSGVLARDRPTVLAGDSTAPTGQDWLVTDGLRHRERNVGRARDNLSQTLAADEEPRQSRPATDILPFHGLEHQTVAAYRGIRGVTASTSAGYADSVRPSDPSSMPFAAVDGDPYSAWQSSTIFGPAGQWLEVDLDTPRVVEQVEMRIVDDERVGWPVARIRIATDSGSRDHDVARGGAPQKFTVAPGLTSKVRVTVLSVAAGRDTGGVGIAELAVPGVTAQRALQVPTDFAPNPGQRASFVFTRGPQPRYACAAMQREQRCDSALTRLGEEPDGIHRLFRTREAGNYRLEGTVLPAAGGKIPIASAATGSTQLAGDPAAAPLAAVDGNAGTTWIADYTDETPTLQLAWQGARTVTGLRLTTSATSGASRPAEVVVRTPAGNRTAQVFSDGSVTFAPVTTDRLTVQITRTEAPAGRVPGPAGISEVKITGAEGVFPPIPQDTRFTVPCGFGPPVTVDGTTYQTTVSGTLSDIVNHRPLALGTCRDLAEGIDLPARDHELRTERSESFVVQDVRLLPNTPAAPAARQRPVDVVEWNVTQRELRVGAGETAVISVPENANDGWVATVDGKPLARTRIDGWQQAWVLPAGAEATVSLRFEPDVPYRQRLLIGAVAAGLLLVITVLPVRRRVRISTEPGGEQWVAVTLVVLLAALGGILAVVLLIASLLVQAVFRRKVLVSGILAVGGMAVATVVSVIGRLQGEGQAWAYGPVAQAAILVSLATVVSACVDWFDPRPELDEGTEAGQGGGRGNGARDDLRQRPVPPPQHHRDLGGHGQPRQQGRPPVRAGDAGVQQELHQREQRPDQRERPHGNGAGGVRRSPDQRHDRRS